MMLSALAWHILSKFPPGGNSTGGSLDRTPKGCYNPKGFTETQKGTSKKMEVTNV